MVAASGPLSNEMTTSCTASEASPASSRGRPTSAAIHSAAMTAKPIRPSPAIANVAPASGVPARMRTIAAPFTTPIAVAGASGRAAAVAAMHGANGMPAPIPTRMPPAIAGAADSAARSSSVPAAPARRLAAIAARVRSGRARTIQPPAGRLTMLSTRVSAPTVAACPALRSLWRSSSSVTQAPITMLSPNDAEKTIASRTSRRSRTMLRSGTPPAGRSATGPIAGRSARTTAMAATHSTSEETYGARQPSGPMSAGTIAIARPPPPDVVPP